MSAQDILDHDDFEHNVHSHRGQDENQPRVHPLHIETVQLVRDRMPEENTLQELAEFFKVFGDPTRIKILHALTTSEMCVYDIAALLKMKQPAVSHQLRILKQSNLVKHKKDGKMVYYSLDDDHIKQIFDKAMIHISEG
jgi:ArsR family transcriptional regulator